MCVLRVVVNVARKATATAIAHNVKSMFGLALAEVTTRAQFAQHRISNAVSQRLEIHGFVRAGVPVDESSRNVNDAVSRMHQVFGYGGNPLCVARTAGTRRVAQVARKRKQTNMSIFLLDGPVIAGVTSNAIGLCEGMRVAEPGRFRGVALQTGTASYRDDLVAKSRMRRQEKCTAQTKGENCFVSHGLLIAEPAMCAYYLRRYSCNCAVSHSPEGTASFPSHSIKYGFLLIELALARRSMNFSAVGA